MHGLLALLAISAASVNAQNSNVTALVNALNGAGLTTLATVAGQIAGTPIGQQVLGALTSGNNFTVFAPNNHAFTGVPKNISGNPTLLSEVLSYHVLPGSFPASVFGSSNTVGFTLLNATDQVKLPNNGSQAIAVKKESDGKVRIQNQNTPATVLNSTSAGNVIIHVVDAVIDLPHDIAGFATQYNLTGFVGAVSAVPGLLQTIAGSKGLTIFAPTNNALTKALASLGGAASNTTLIGDILANHIINGSVVYSPSLSSELKATSAGGQPFNFTATTVKSGNSTATITQADGIVQNGVIHIIDTVLANTASDPSAASSAAAAATSSASSNGTSQTQTGPLPTATSNSSSNGTSGGNGGKSAGVSLNVGIKVWSGVCLSVVFGMGLLL